MSNLKNFAFWAVLIIGISLAYPFFSGDANRTEYQKITYSDFKKAVEAGTVKKVIIQPEAIIGKISENNAFITYYNGDTGLPDRLADQGVSVEISPSGEGGFLSYLLTSILPIFLLVGLWFYVMRQMQGGGGRGALTFGKSRAKLLTEHTGRVTFSDVAGIDEAKEELNEIVDFLKEPKKFQRLGGKIPKGALLVGPPGTGKTLLARAIAGEANVPFFSISGSDFVEMFVGVGASRVRDMFEQAKKNAPCIIFIDEIDAVGRHRGMGMGGGSDEREQTLNQLLVEMDGFEANEGIIIIAATNRPDVLDPALLRPGRFDRQVTVPNPDVNGREEILRVHMKKVTTAPDADAKILARGTPGFSGADLANLVNEAALSAARKNKRMVTLADFESAKDKVMMGAERRSMAMNEEEKSLTAYHEAGHALVGIHIKGNDPLHKVTIIPRGRALGVTMNLPERDKWSVKRSELLAKLAMMFGGRVAEEIIFGEENVTTGASNDIMQATEIARGMVTMYGMSNALGAVRYKEKDEGYLGGSSGLSAVAEETKNLIDAEVRRFIDDAEKTARRVLTDHKDQLEMIARALLEYETLSGEEVMTLIKGGNISRDGLNRKPENSAFGFFKNPDAAPENVVSQYNGTNLN